MSDTTPSSISSTGASGAESPLTLALSVATFFAVSYLLCVAGALVIPPGGVVHRLLPIVPGFAWNPSGIMLGLVATIGGGIYFGLVFGLIHRSIKRLVDRASIRTGTAS